ncbi:FAD/NAD(P)-binding protein [Streptomyces sp. NPDC018045]|uniref:FAD/NAD(P)-binding protein n=1 Tax=Streptomyces sp. NPDC018045 TaxID=3365037 RepID=UPI0037B3D422
MNHDAVTVAVIGGGASGILACVHLLEASAASRRPVRISLIEPSEELGRGTAYASSDPRHLMNTPVERSAARAHDPGHLVAWLRRRDPDASPGHYLPRGTYGAYLADTLRETRERTAATGQLCHVRRRARRVLAGLPRPVVALSDGRCTAADRVVFAMGNTATWCDPFASAQVGPRYVRSPWHSGVPAVADHSSVLLLGNGLTAVDIGLSLLGGSVGVRVDAVSRHGLLPRPHGAGCSHGGHPNVVGALLADDRLTLARLVGTVRSEMRSSPECWREIIDALRPCAGELWGRLDADDQRDFLGRFGTYWDVHRHRLPPDTARRLGRALGSGRLKTRKGRAAYLRACPRGVIAGLDIGAGAVPARYDWVINCTGFGRDITGSTDPLLTWLLRDGLAVPDSLRLGLATDRHGRLLDRAGRPHPALLTIGPLRRGSQWETTAIAEIRAQAAQLADDILRVPSPDPAVLLHQGGRAPSS